MRLTRISAVATAGVVLLLCMSASASAASSPFGCRASANRLGLDGTTIVEPLIANAPTTPCANDTRGLSSTSAQDGGSVTANTGPAEVSTATNSSPAAAALASVSGATVPTSSGSVVVAGPAYAEAAYSCVNGSVVPTVTSTLDSVNVNGSPETIAPNQNDTIQLGGGSYMIANETIQTGNSLTERLLDVHLAGGLEIVVGEAEVTQNSSHPCAGGSGGGGGGVGVPITICPSGSSYDVGLQACVIYLSGGRVITIGQPFGGETGGTVMTLSEARKLYRSACLYGSGPNYVIVSTRSHAHIQGTYRAERILALGGHSVVKGGGGNDCIAGPGGNDNLRDANGSVRVYGGPGHNRIFIRNGNDRVWLGSGKNRISAGRGSDWLYGGKGFDVFYIDNGPKHVFAGARGGRVYAPGARDAVACRSRRDRVYVNTYALRYAQHHGCVAPHRLVPAQL